MGVLSRAAVCLAVLVAFCCVRPLQATSYPAVTFDELISRADVIFVGEVVDVRPYAVSTRDGDLIRTRVIFRVSDPLFGTTSVQEVFDVLGGELNGVGMKVSDMPAFAVGDRRMVFARRERSINPIVGFTQGLLRVERDSGGVDRVFTLEGIPLAGTESIGTASLSNAPLRSASMRLTDMRARVAGRIAEMRK